MKEQPTKMKNSDLNWIANYVWGIAAEVLRDTIQFSLQEEGGFEAFLRCEIHP